MNCTKHSYVFEFRYGCLFMLMETFDIIGDEPYTFWNKFESKYFITNTSTTGRKNSINYSISQFIFS